MSTDIDSLEAHARRLRRGDTVAWTRQRVLPLLAMVTSALVAGAGFGYALPVVL